MIPEAAVEAAGQALRDAFDWGVTDFDKQARAALEAAYPFIAAQALTEAVDAFPLETITAPDNAVVWMIRRAEEIRNQA